MDTATQSVIPNNTTSQAAMFSSDVTTCESSASGLRLDERRPMADTLVLAVGGELDLLTAPDLVTRISTRLDGSLRVIALDLSHLGFIGAAGMSALLESRALAERNGAALHVVTGDNRCVVRALKLTGLYEYLAVHLNVDAAVNDRGLAEADRVGLPDVPVRHV